MRHTHFFCFLYTIRRPFDRRRRTRTLHSVLCALLQVQHAMDVMRCGTKKDFLPFGEFISAIRGLLDYL